MNKRFFRTSGFAVAGFMVAAFSAFNVAAQDAPKATPASDQTVTAPASQTATLQLSPGVPDVLRLVQSKIGDETVVAFISNTGKTYKLSASEIIYLREQGASDRVLAAMLNQSSQSPVTAAPVATAPVTPAPAITAPAATVWAPPAQPSIAYTAPAPTYVQPTTVYVPQPVPVYNYYYPDYGYYYPPVALSIGLGFGWYHGGGGWHGGGGFHGGGHGGRR